MNVTDVVNKMQEINDRLAIMCDVDIAAKPRQEESKAIRELVTALGVELIEQLESCYNRPRSAVYHYDGGRRNTEDDEVDVI